MSIADYDDDVEGVFRVLCTDDTRRRFMHGASSTVSRYSERADPIFKEFGHTFLVSVTRCLILVGTMPNSGWQLLEQLEKNIPSSAIDGRPLNIPFANVLFNECC
jgi:hypothetical protein